VRPPRAKSLPRISDAAWHGPIGEAVAEIAPATEADPVAILVSTLALFGAVIGDRPHVRVGGVRHPARLWPLIVGRTAAGRKGTSWAESRNFVSSFSSSYCRDRIISGLSSGEGLIAALTGDEESKAPDGLLTVVEPEFVRVLAAAKREGNTLSPVLRSLWDDGQAAILTRTAPLSCAGSHVTLIAHVTPRELRMRLGENDIAGGTVNRLLPVLTERSQLLPHEPARAELGHLSARLADALDRAKGTNEVRRTKESDDLWTHAYAALADDEPDGMLGAVLARGPAYTMRLALTYALADGSRAITVEHLTAALAVWQYAADSSRLLFGDLSGSSDLDRLCDFLARSPGGRTKTEITRDCFKGNVKADAIDMMLDALEKAGDIAQETAKGAKGRPTTRFYWIAPARDRLTALLAGEPMEHERNEGTN
jgi:hypothetical protein